MPFPIRDWERDESCRSIRSRKPFLSRSQRLPPKAGQARPEGIPLGLGTFNSRFPRKQSLLNLRSQSEIGNEMEHKLF